MMLRYSFNQQAAADAIEKAVSLVLDQGCAPATSGRPVAPKSVRRKWATQ
jgi:isocitrate/isopropylmalate dehydrogenase